MEQEATKIEELKARRDALRERLRAKAEQIVAAVEALPEPKTFLEAQRAARMVILADRMVERVFSEPKAVKDNERFKAAGYGVLGSEIGAKKAPSVTSSPEGFAVLRSTNDSLDRSLAHPPASQGRINDASPIADAKGEDEAKAKPTAATVKPPFRSPSRKALKSGASSLIIGAKRPDAVLRECLKGLGP